MFNAFGKKGDEQGRTIFMLLHEAVFSCLSFILIETEMMTLNQLTLVLVFFCTASIAAAQNAVLVLAPFEVTDNRLPEKNPGLASTSIDAAGNPIQSGYSLAELLSRNTAFTIRQNSPGTLASPSFRGTAATHTAIIWNGFNLQSCMNGQLDLNLIPAFLFESFRVQAGANSSSWGSGAIGGAIFLDSELSGNHIGFQQQNGSWGTSRSAFKASFSARHFSLSVKAFRQSALNDYQFHNTALASGALQRQTNAVQKQEGLIADLRIPTGRKQYVLLSGWLQKGGRHIPPVLTIPVSVAKQDDEVQRFTASWNYTGGLFTIKAQSGYFTERINFQDSLSNINAHNFAKTFVQEATAGLRLSRAFQLQVGLNATDCAATTDGFGNKTVQQHRRAIFASWKSGLLDEKLQVLLSARQEWFHGKMVPFIPSFSASYFWKDKLKFRGQIAKVYRVPTLNDLYWIPGGNPDLKPESGISTEAGISWTRKYKNVEFTVDGGVFSNLINDWIQWTPGPSYWSPRNLQKVYSRGIEQSLEALVTRKNFQLKFRSSLQLVKSTAVEGSVPTISTGKQLIYVPFAVWNQVLSLTNHGFSAEVNGTLSGSRYTSTDNSESLPAFYLLNFSLAKRLIYAQYTSTIFFQLNNLLQQEYQLTAGRPMPLLSWQAGISFEFNP